MVPLLWLDRPTVALAGPRVTVLAPESQRDQLQAVRSYALAGMAQVEVLHDDGGAIDPDTADAVLVNAGATHPLPSWLDALRPGTLLIGVALLGGSVLRWLLPDVGMLAVRSRFTDVATYGVLGLVIVLLALMIQPDPLLKLSFLKYILHFTVR